MSNSISSVSSLTTANLGQVSRNSSTEAVGETSFKDSLLKSIDEVNSLQQDANRAVEQLAAGGETTPAEVLTAVQKADVAFRMMLQVRNKLVQAYQEVQNIRV